MTLEEFKGTEDEKAFYDGVLRFCKILGDLVKFDVDSAKVSRRKNKGFTVYVTMKKGTDGMAIQTAVKIGERLTTQFPAIYAPTFYKRYGTLEVQKPKGLRNGFMVEAVDEYIG